MLFVIAFDFHVSERFKHFVERRKILALARFILCRENNVGDRLGQLDVSDAFPLGIRFRGRYSLIKYGWPSPVFTVSTFSLGLPCTFSIWLIAMATNFPTSS